MAALGCVPKSKRRGGGGEWARVVSFTGMATAKDVKAEAEGTTAADIMMEHPQHYVCEAASMKAGTRGISAALAAEEPLVGGTVYYVLPMSSMALHSPLSASQAALLAFRARAALRGRRAGAGTSICSGVSWHVGRFVAAVRGVCTMLSLLRQRRAVAPLNASASAAAAAEEPKAPWLLKAEQEEEEEEEDMLQIQRRLSVCRSRQWRPTLETIAESL